MRLKKFYCLYTNDNSWVLGNLAFKLVGTGYSGAIQLTRVKFDAPGNIDSAANGISGCKSKQTQRSSQTQQQENAIHSTLHVFVA